MSYIGNPIISTDFPKDTFSGNGSTTAFTMSIAPASVNAVIVVVSGITQDPSTYTISGTTLTFSGAPPTGTSNISVRHLGIAGIPNTPSAASVVTASIADANVTYAKLSGDLQRSGMKNRIINGAMVINQRGFSGSITDTGAVTYTLDRWNAYGSVTAKFSVAQSSTAPTGFSNSLLVTSSSAYTVGAGEFFLINQPIEGFNTADLGWGTANAKTVTLSFQVYSSLTGTFGGSITNSGNSRSYPFTYTVSSANTWTTASVTIAGDTSGTWIGATNGIGLYVRFGLGVGSTYSGTAGSWSGNAYYSATGATSVVGTSGATFYITGVQLEVGSSATGFEYVNYQTSLTNCQRYLPVMQGYTGDLYTGSAVTTTVTQTQFAFNVTPRIPPTGITNTALSNFGTYVPATTGQPSPTAISFNKAGLYNATLNISVASGFTAGQTIQFFPTSSSGQILFTGCEL